MFERAPVQKKSLKARIGAGALVVAAAAGSFMAGYQSGRDSERAAQLQQDFNALDEKVKNKEEQLTAQKIEQKIENGSELTIGNFGIVAQLPKGGKEGNVTREISYPIVDLKELAKLELNINVGAFKFWSASKNSDGTPLVREFTFDPKTMSIFFHDKSGNIDFFSGVLQAGDPASPYYGFVSVAGDASFGPVAAEQILAPDAPEA